MRSGPAELERARVVLVQALRPVLERLGVVGVEALDGLRHEARALDREADARHVQRRGVGEDEALGERAGLGIGVPQAGDAVVEQPAPGAQERREPRGVRVDVRAADVLDHADRGDLVVGLAGEVAPVHDVDVDEVADARLLGALPRADGLRLRERHARRAHAVLARRVHDEAAPAAADVEQPLARLQLQLAADEVELRALRLLERLRPAREDRARVRHRRVEEEREELVADVVVVADGAQVALAAVAPADRPQLRGGRLRRERQARRAGGCRGERRLRAEVERRGLPAVEEVEHGSMSSTSISPATYARPRPSCPGARSAWASARCERTVNVGPPPPFVEGSDVPSQSLIVNGRSGSASAIASRSGAVLLKAARAGRPCAPCAPG